MVHLLATFPGHYGTPVMRIKEEMTENREANNDPPILLLPPTRTRRARPPDCTTCYHRKWGRTEGGSNLKTTLIGAQHYPPASLERAVEVRGGGRGVGGGVVVGGTGGGAPGRLVPGGYSPPSWSTEGLELWTLPPLSQLR